MNYAEHNMRASGVSRDRRSIDVGWAGWHTKRPSLAVRLWRRWRDPLAVVLMFGSAGVGAFFYLSR